MEFQGPGGVYSNLYAELGIPIGTSVIISNKGFHCVYIEQSLLIPSSGGYELQPGKTCMVNGHNGQHVWVKGSPANLFVQPLVNTIMPFSAVDLPHYLYTSHMERYRRLRVDVAQTGFFEGREFRTFREFSIPSGSNLVIRANAAVDTILHELTVTVDEGSLRVTTLVGGTPDGAFGEALPVLPKNNMTERPEPIYTSVNTLQAGGSLTGGTALDVIRVVSSTATSQRTTVGGAVSSERGVAVGTYYFKLENISSGDCTGVFSGWWEERPLPNF